MMRLKLLAPLALLAATACATPSHNLYVVATVNNNFVVGSKMVTLSGLFQRGADNTYGHFGLNFPYFVSMAVDPRDPKVLYVASINGVPHLSIGDGWWAEGYTGDNGWLIDPRTSGDQEAIDEADAEALYQLLEREIVPIFYDRDHDLIPRRWLGYVRRAIVSVTPRFSLSICR